MDNRENKVSIIVCVGNNKTDNVASANYKV